MPNASLPDWEKVLTSAAHLQRILPEAVLVGGTAAALYAGHPFSADADHVLPDLAQRFDRVLADLECVAGWKTARVQRPVQILGKLDGIETGVRQLIRDEPLETTRIERLGMTLDRVSGGGDTIYHNIHYANKIGLARSTASRASGPRQLLLPHVEGCKLLEFQFDGTGDVQDIQRPATLSAFATVLVVERARLRFRHRPRLVRVQTRPIIHRCGFAGLRDDRRR